MCVNLNEIESERRALVVAVARDLLARLEAPDPGFTLRIKYTYLEWCDTAGEADCTCCMLGGCLLSLVRLGAVPQDEVHSHSLVHPKLTRGKYIAIRSVSRPRLVEHLSAAFDEETLDMIESAFEYRSLQASPGRYASKYADAAAWGRRYATDHARAVAIARNLIANGGRFDPDWREPVEVEVEPKADGVVPAIEPVVWVPDLATV